MKLEDLDLDDDGLVDTPIGDDSGINPDEDKTWMGTDYYTDVPAGDGDNNDADNGDDSLNNDDTDIISALLLSKGINPESVKFQNENGEIEEKNFNDLSREEQLQILNFEDSQDDYGLDNDEIALVNELRENGMSLEEYKNYIGSSAVQKYINENSEETTTYDVDSISDDELYILDLKAKVPELSEEEASSELENAKQNQELYQKKVNGIRKEYKQREDALSAQNEEEQRVKNEEEAKRFEETIITAIQNYGDIDLGDSTLSLSEDDMNDVASFILDSDPAGVRYIAKALNDPKTLVEMAWYALKGKEAFSQFSNYYKQKITETSKNNYNKGFEDAKNGVKPNKTKTVVRKNSAGTPAKKPLTINDLD